MIVRTERIEHIVPSEPERSLKYKKKRLTLSSKHSIWYSFLLNSRSNQPLDVGKHVLESLGPLLICVELKLNTQVFDPIFFDPASKLKKLVTTRVSSMVMR